VSRLDLHGDYLAKGYVMTRSTATLLLLGLIAMSACSSASTPHQIDEAAIYAAVIRRIYTQDDTFGGSLQAPTVYVLQITDDSVGDPAIDPSEPSALPGAVQNKIDSSLAGMSMRIVWISDPSNVPVDPGTGAVGDGGALITLGNLHLQRDGSVQVSASIYVAPLAAGGRTYILKQVDGDWQVTGNTGAVWMN
jgi:hypothetical protein